MPRPAGRCRPATVIDALTGLPNRALFRDRLDQLLGRVAEDDPLIGVLVVRLEGARGDGTTSRPRGRGRASSPAPASGSAGAMDPDDGVGRTQDDELAVLHVTDGTIDDFTDLTDRVRVALSPPYAIGEVTLVVKPPASACRSVLPATPRPTSLLSEAEATVARAVGSGPGPHRALRPRSAPPGPPPDRSGHGPAAGHRRRRAHRGVAGHAPLQPTEAGQPEEVWAEALVRWQNPERGLVSPGNFIHLAEETGFVVPVGDLVLRKACRQLARWRATPGHPTRPGSRSTSRLDSSPTTTWPPRSPRPWPRPKSSPRL